MAMAFVSQSVDLRVSDKFLNASCSAALHAVIPVLDTGIHAAEL